VGPACLRGEEREEEGRRGGNSSDSCLRQAWTWAGGVVCQSEKEFYGHGLILLSCIVKHLASRTQTRKARFRSRLRRHGTWDGFEEDRQQKARRQQERKRHIANTLLYLYIILCAGKEGKERERRKKSHLRLFTQSLYVSRRKKKKSRKRKKGDQTCRERRRKRRREGRAGWLPY